jgi:hypothetical protein
MNDPPRTFHSVQTTCSKFEFPYTPPARMILLNPRSAINPVATWCLYRVAA